MSAHNPPADAFASHDHGHCVQDALGAAIARSTREGLQLTPVRRRVLELLLEAHRAMGAYEILARLDAEGLGRQPPIAYRALDFLVTHGFAHRLERLNAFIACSWPETLHRPAFMICRGCHAVAEAPGDNPHKDMERIADGVGFRLESAVLEAEGLCPACNGQAGDR